jgi:hypothetical protein
MTGATGRSGVTGVTGVAIPAAPGTWIRGITGGGSAWATCCWPSTSEVLPNMPRSACSVHFWAGVPSLMSRIA